MPGSFFCATESDIIPLTFFSPGPATDLGIRATLIEQHSAPEILVHGLVKPEDVEKLFEMYVCRAYLRVLIC